MSQPLTLQAMIAKILQFWSEQGCVIHQGYDLEVGAGTFNPATFLRALGPEPYKTAYVEPSRRPQDGRYGMHPNRLQNYHQLQVILKPVTTDFLSLYKESLQIIGLDLREHDIRFVHDDWENPTIGAWGLGWEVWLNGMEITQLTYFQAIGSKPLDTISGEITYGIERIAMYLQKKNSIFDVLWNDELTYGDITQASEKAWSKYNFDVANTQMWLKHFEDFAQEALATLDQGLPAPAYDFVIKASHAFNILDARGIISVTERTRYITRIRQLARAVADGYVDWRASLNYPLLHKWGAHKDITSQTLPCPKVAKAENFLLEIGSEELPATFVPIGIQQLESLAKKLLSDYNISYESLEVLGSPRRLALLVYKLEPTAVQKAVEKKGPAISSLFNDSGEVTAQGEQFFTSHNVPIHHYNDLSQYSLFEIREINSVNYLFLLHPEKHKDTAIILANELPKLIHSMKFPKKMVYDDSGVEYARPIRWIVSLYGTSILPFSFGKVTASDTSYGHRQLDPREVPIPSCEHYVDTLRDACVIVSHKERREIIEQGLKSHSSNNISPIANPRLLEETVFLTEHPFVTCAQFDQKFCALPKELLIAEMVNHQKYFPTQNTAGEITNQFILVCDNCPNDIIIEGNQKALTPRLTDGDFLFAQDLKTSLTTFVDKLKAVTYFEALGSLYDKVERLKAHKEIVYPLMPLSSQEDITTAIEFCKADLVSAVVNEFAELQGIMGEYYLKHAGLSHAAAVAVGEHLCHITDGQTISTTGTLLSIIDRFDNLLSCFILNLRPTSSHDPYALRRQSLEILTLLHASEVSLNLENLLHHLADNFPSTVQETTWDKPATIRDILAFIWGRLKTFMASLGFSKDEIATVFSDTSEKNPVEIIKSAKGIQSIKNSQKTVLEKITTTHNRLKKILASLKFSISTHTQTQLEMQESRLKAALDHFDASVKIKDSKEDYFLSLGELTDSINIFLNEVHVTSGDEELKNLRIHLLLTAMEKFSPYCWEALKT
ncbi:Glycine--tRNA ligase alpha subunit,glycyl-tRNA synthetase,glycine--tRNA ligase, beta subunit,Glycyl-tRNA synthetase beta subunit [Chlamydia poikilotherma]|uniref:Multifunctional fusion protein n=1 Tax=Chlamydia poikilotherma TaxID=1967783 RepID=A0A3B0Q164_9CHLA|nr:glycine--tRNA ligase [Chlamydia poikilotherma]SYX09285.1 Glycine--tRNA ligase alpha subunit,glycyl-tRNA synthetase,glycine--tRNA ligase, beta subunit,Glycyl-tRNA synthetase beta subunit [Chlamydia poikilotherma]